MKQLILRRVLPLRFAMATPVVLIASLLVPALSVTADAATTPSKAAQEARANDLEDASLAYFMTIQRTSATKRSAVDKMFDWSNDGCSAPWWTMPATGVWSQVFKSACIRHDFGYRNFGKLPRAYESTGAKKKAIDSLLLSDMRGSCTGTAEFIASCYTAAQGFYLAVSRSGQSWSAFTGKQCLPDKLCLFDDTGYADRRLTWYDHGENDMNDVDFGDKTSSAWNNTKVAWVLYDDHDYKDRNLCLRAGKKVSNLASSPYKFGDKTSSLKRRSDNTCPSGSIVV